MKNELDTPKNISNLYKEISSVLRTARINSSDASDELSQYFQFQILNLGTKYECI